MKTIMEAVMDRITIDTSIYEFTKEIKVRPTDKTIDAHCVYGLTTEYTFNKETDDFDEERHVLIEELFVPPRHRAGSAQSGSQRCQEAVSEYGD